MTAASNLPTIQTAAAAAGMGMLPFFPNQHIVGQALPGQNNAPEKQSTTEAVVSGSQPYHQTLTNLPAGALRAGHAKQQNQLKSTDTSLGVRNTECNQFLFLWYFSCFFLAWGFVCLFVFE